jgi:hypothetical protein
MSANDKLTVEVLYPESKEIEEVLLSELPMRAKNGSLLPSHQVRIKGLVWIEAQNLPALKSVFNGEDESTSKEKNEPAKPSGVVKATKVQKTVQAKKKAEKSGEKSGGTTIKGAKAHIIGIGLALLLAYVISFCWIYILKSLPQADEKTVPEIAALKSKLDNDEKNIRPNAGANSAQNNDASKQIAEMKKVFAAEKVKLMQKYIEKTQTSDFYFDFIVLSLILIGGYFGAFFYYGKQS